MQLVAHKKDNDCVKSELLAKKQRRFPKGSGPPKEAVPKRKRFPKARGHQKQVALTEMQNLQGYFSLLHGVKVRVNL